MPDFAAACALMLTAFEILLSGNRLVVVLVRGCLHDCACCLESAIIEGEPASIGNL